MILCESMDGRTVPVPKASLIVRPSVYGVILADDRLLVVRSRGSGKLCFPGGGVELGERIEAALRREVREETGLEVEVGPFLHFKEHFFYYEPLDEAYQSYMVFYRCHPKTTALAEDCDVDDDDAEQPRWLQMACLEREAFMPPFREVVDRLLMGEG